MTISTSNQTNGDDGMCGSMHTEGAEVKTNKSYPLEVIIWNSV